MKFKCHSIFQTFHKTSGCSQISLIRQSVVSRKTPHTNVTSTQRQNMVEILTNVFLGFVDQG